MVTRAGGESLQAQCDRLQREWMEAEYERMSGDYCPSTGVDMASGALGPLYCATVTLGEKPIEALINPGSSATIVSFDLFKRIGSRGAESTFAMVRHDCIKMEFFSLSLNHD